MEKIRTWWRWTETYRCWAKRRSLSWIQQQCSSMLRVFRKLFMFQTKSSGDEKCGNNEELKPGFVASNDWLTKFMKWNNLFMRRRTTIAQKDPSHLTTKLVKYVTHVRRLFNENELLTRLYNCNGRNCRLVWHGWECDGWYHCDKSWMYFPNQPEMKSSKSAYA